MNNKFMQAVSLVIAFVVALGGAGGTIAVVSHYVSSLETKVASVEGTIAVVAAKQDVAAADLHEIKAQLDTIAPRSVPGRAVGQAIPPALPAAPLAPVATTGRAAADPNDNVATWPARYLADHCRRCPSCCVTAATGVP